jgi:polysaccharide export outer membrane protein
MSLPIRFHNSKRRGENMRVMGVAVAIAAFGFQVACGAESIMRVVGTRHEVKPPVSDSAGAQRDHVARRDSGVKRESIVRVATASSSVLGRQESKLVERPAADESAQSNDFTNAMREAAALRDAIDDAAPSAGDVLAPKTVTQPTAPPTNLSALRLARPATTPTTTPMRKPTPTATTAVPVIRVPAPVVATPSAAPAVPSQNAVANTPAPIAAAPLWVERIPAPAAPAPSNVATAPAPLAPARPPVFDAPATIAAEPARIANLPVVVHAPTAVRTPSPIANQAPVNTSVAATRATYHPHAPAAPPHTHAAPNGCPSETGVEEYDLTAELGCAYGPGQSGAHSVCGVDCGVHGAPCNAGWHNAHCIPWSLFGPGEYVGPSRTEHVSNYYLRVNDLLTLTYINSRQKIGERYRFGVGDRLLIESSLDESLRREVDVQPDGEITLPIVGEVMAAGKTVKELRDDLTEVFKEAQRQPQITVTPITVNSGQQEIIKAVTSQLSPNGQALDLKVTPEGTIQVPGIGSVYAQGLTLDELRSELEARYAATFGTGLMISPALRERAISYVFIGGEVKTPGRYVLEGPTTATQAISSMAGSWNIGANLHQVVVFRRDENWCLKAIKIDIRAPLYGNDPCPVNDVWLRDNDLVLVPKSKILCATDVIDLYMTRGVYAAFPVTFFQNLSAGSSVSTVVTSP